MKAYPSLIRATLTVIIGLASSLCLAAAGSPTGSSSQWISLFDGKSLEGWTPKIQGFSAGQNPGHIFRIENGTILATYADYREFDDEFGHLFHDVPYSRYKLRLEYKFIGEQLKGGPNWGYLNSGVMIHGQTAESMGRDQSFPDSIEVQFLGSDDKAQRPTGNICTPGTQADFEGQPMEGHCRQSSSPPVPANEWVKMEVHVLGSEALIVFVDGIEVMKVTNLRMDDGTPLASGTLSLQAESHDCAYRNIEILPLE